MVEHGGAEVKRRAEALVCLVGVIEAVDENLKREGWEVRDVLLLTNVGKVSWVRSRNHG